MRAVYFDFDNFVRRTPQEGVISLKMAVLRAKTVKEINEQNFEKQIGNGNFGRKKFNNFNTNGNYNNVNNEVCNNDKKEKE